MPSSSLVLPGVLYQNTTAWVAERTDTYFLNDSRGQKSAIQASTGLVSPKASLCLAGGRLLPVVPVCPLLCACVSLVFPPLLIRTIVLLFRVPPSWPHLTYISSISRASQATLVVRNPPASAGDVKDTGLIPGL